MDHRALDQSSLGPAERESVEAVVAALGKAMTENLVSVWLYGSKARGEAPGPDSDIDLMIVARGGRSRWWGTVWGVIEEVAPRYGGDPIVFSPCVVDPSWLDGRRQIGSFFIQEVDRDRLVLAGAE